MKPNEEQSVSCQLLTQTYFLRALWTIDSLKNKLQRVSDLLHVQKSRSIYQYSWYIFAHCLQCQEKHRYGQQHPEEVEQYWGQ